MGTQEDPLSCLDTHVSIIRELLGMISVTDGLPRNHILHQSAEDIKSAMRFCSVTFTDDNLIEDMYRGYESEDIPKWENGEQCVKLLQTFFKRTRVEDKDLKEKMLGEFGPNTSEKLTFESIRKLMKYHGNTYIKTTLHDFMFLGSQIADFLFDKDKLWQDSIKHYEDWTNVREEFSNLDEDMDIAEVEGRYTLTMDHFEAASDAITAYLKRTVKKFKHLKSNDILLAYNYKELVAAEDSLPEMMDKDETMGIYKLNSNLKAKEFFQDFRICYRNDKEKLEDFRKRAKTRETTPQIEQDRNDDNRRLSTGGTTIHTNNVDNTSGQGGSGTNSDSTQRSRRNTNSEESPAARAAEERKRITKTKIERMADREIREADRLVKNYPLDGIPDRKYEGKIVVSLSSLQALLNDTLKEERSGSDDYLFYVNINDPSQGGRSLVTQLRIRIEELTEIKLKLSEMDKKYVKMKEDRIKLLQEFKIKKIENAEDFVAWFHDYSDMMDKIFKDAVLDPEDDIVKQKLLSKLENTIPRQDLQKLENFKTVGEKFQKFISSYDTNVNLLVEKNISDILKMKNPDKDEKASLKNIETFLQKIESLYKLNCLYLISRDDMDKFPVKIFTNFKSRQYFNSLSKFKTLETDQQDRLLKTGDFTILEQLSNIVTNNQLLQNFNRSYLADDSGLNTGRTSGIFMQNTQANVDTSTENPVTQIKTCLRKVTTNLKQNAINAILDRVFHFLVVFATKEKQTLTEKLSNLNIKYDLSRDTKNSKKERGAFKKDSPRKQTKNKEKPKKQNVLLAKSSATQPTRPKERGFKNKPFEKSYKPKFKQKRKAPIHPCPIGCRTQEGKIHLVPYGSASFCHNFQNMTLEKREMVMKSKPDILRCCLRNMKHELGHMPKDRKNCKVKHCRHCKRQGHSSLLCKDPAAPHNNQSQKKAIKVAHKSQTPEDDPEDEEEYDSDSEDEDTDEEPDEEDDLQEDDYEESDDSDSEIEDGDENEEGDESNYIDDDARYEDSDTDSQGEEEIKITPRVNMIRKVNMIRANPKNTDTVVPTRKNPKRNCKKTQNYEFAEDKTTTPPKRTRGRKVKDSKSMLKPATIKTNVPISVLEDIAQQKVIETLSTAINQDTVLSTLMNINKSRLEEIKSLSTICENLRECENEYIKILVNNSNKQMESLKSKTNPAPTFSPDRDYPACNSDATEESCDENQKTDYQDQTAQAVVGDDYQPTPEVEDDEPELVEETPQPEFTEETPQPEFTEEAPQPELTEETPQNEPLEVAKVYEEDILIFEHEFRETYGEDEDTSELELHVNNLKSIIEESNLSIISLASMMNSVKKLNHATIHLQESFQTTKDMEPRDLKIIANILQRLARKGIYNLLRASNESPEITEYQESLNIQRKVIRMIRRSLEENHIQCNDTDSDPEEGEDKENIPPVLQLIEEEESDGSIGESISIPSLHEQELPSEDDSGMNSPCPTPASEARNDQRQYFDSSIEDISPESIEKLQEACKLKKITNENLAELIEASDDGPARDAFEQEHEEIYGKESDLRIAMKRIGILGPRSDEIGINHLLKLIIPFRHSIGETCYQLMCKFNLYGKRFQGPVKTISQILLNLLWRKISMNGDWNGDYSDENLHKPDERAKVWKARHLRNWYRQICKNEDQFSKNDFGLQETLASDLEYRIKEFTSDMNIEIDPELIKDSTKVYRNVNQANLNGINGRTFCFNDSRKEFKEAGEIVATIEFEELVTEDLISWQPRSPWDELANSASILVVTKENDETNVCGRVMSYNHSMGNLVNYWNAVTEEHQSTNLFLPENRYYKCSFVIEFDDPAPRKRVMMIRKTRSSNREDINQDSPMELDVEVSSDEDASVSSSTVADPSEEHEDEPETPTPNTHRDHLMLDGRHCLNLLYSIKPGSKLLELMVFQRTLNEAPIQEHYTLLDVVDTITQHINMNNLRTPDNQSMVKCSTLMKDAFDQDYIYSGEVGYFMKRELSLVRDSEKYKEVFKGANRFKTPFLPSEIEEENLNSYPAMKIEIRLDNTVPNLFDKDTKFKLKDELHSLLKKHSTKIERDQNDFTWEEVHNATVETLNKLKHLWADEKNPNIMQFKDELYDLFKVRVMHWVQLPNFLIPHLQIMQYVEAEKHSPQSKSDRERDHQSKTENEIKIHLILFKKGKWWFGFKSNEDPRCSEGEAAIEAQINEEILSQPAPIEPEPEKNRASLQDSQNQRDGMIQSQDTEEENESVNKAAISEKVKNIISNLQQSDCDRIIQWKSVYNFRDNSSLLKFVQSCMKEDFREQYTLETIFKCIVNYIAKNKLFDPKNKLIVIADDLLMHALGYKVMHYQELEMICLQHLNLHTDFRVKLMRHDVYTNSISVNAILDTYDEKKASRIICRFLCEKYGGEYREEYLKMFAADTHPTCNITVVSDVKTLGVVPFSRPVSHREREEVVMNSITLGLPDSGTFRSDVLGLQDIMSNQAKEIRRHEEILNKQNYVVRPYFLPHDLPPDSYVAHHLDLIHDNETPIADKITPYRFNQESQEKFLHYTLIDEIRLRTIDTQVYLTTSTKRSGFETLRVVAACPQEKDLCKIRSLNGIKPCQYTIQLKFENNKGKYYYEISCVLTADKTKPEKHYVEEMKTLGTALNYGHYHYNQSTRQLEVLNMCYNCGCTPPLKCEQDCTNEDMVMRHPMVALSSAKDHRYQKEKPKHKWMNQPFSREINKLGFNRPYINYDTANFQPSTLPKDPEVYYDNKRKEKVNIKIALSGTLKYIREKGIDPKKRPGIKYHHSKSPHQLDKEGIPKKLQGYVSRKPKEYKMQMCYTNWKRPEELLDSCGFLGMNRGHFCATTPPYVESPDISEVIYDEKALPTYREDPNNNRKKALQRYYVEYQPDRLWPQECWWDYKEQGRDPRYLSRPVNPEILKNKIISLKPQFHAFFMQHREYLLWEEPNLKWNIQDKWMSFKSLIEVFRRFVVTTRVSQNYANLLIVNLKKSQMSKLLGVDYLHSSQLIYHAQLMVDRTEDIPANELNLTLEQVVSRMNVYDGQNKQAQFLLANSGDLPLEFKKDISNSSIPTDPIELDDYVDYMETDDANFARRICMVKKARKPHEESTEAEVDEDDCSSTTGNVDQNEDKQSDICKGLEKAAIHRYLNDEGPEMEEIKQFTQDKINGLHSGYEKEIEERLKLEVEGVKSSNPKKACQATGNKDMDEQISALKILRASMGAISVKPNEEALHKLEEMNKNPLQFGNEETEFINSSHPRYQELINEGSNLYNSSERIVSDGFDVRIERSSKVNNRKCHKYGMTLGEHLGIPIVEARCISDSGANVTIGDRRLLELGIAEPVNGEEEQCFTAGDTEISAIPARIKLVMRDGKKISIGVSLLEKVGGGPDYSISTLQRKIYCSLFGIKKEQERYFNFGKATNDVMLLIGTDNSRLQSTVLSSTQLKDLGFNIPTVSPNATILYNPLGINQFSPSGTIGINPGVETDEVLLPIGKDKVVTIPMIEYDSTSSKHTVSMVFKTKKIKIDDHKQNIPKVDKSKVKIGETKNKVRYLKKETTDLNALQDILSVAGTDGLQEYNQTVDQDQRLWLEPADEESLWNTILLEEKFAEQIRRKQKKKVFLVKKVRKKPANDFLISDGKDFKIRQDIRFGITETNERVFKLTKVNNRLKEDYNRVDTATFSEERTNDIMYLFLKQLLSENNFPAMPKICLEHSTTINNCSKCNNRGKVSETDEKLYDTIKNSARKIIEKDKNGKDVVKYQFDLISSGSKTKEEIFSPEKSNMKRVLKETERLIKKLKKENLLEAFDKNIQETIQKGYLIKLSAEEIKNLKKEPHHYVSLNYAVNEHSKTTPVRPITDTSRLITGETISHSQTFISPPGFLNNIEGCHRQATFHEIAMALDIQKAYLQIRLSEADAKFTLVLWKEDPNDEESDFMVLRYNSFSFGNSQSSSVLHILVTEFGSGNCKTELGKIILIKFSLADDVLSSFSDVKKLWITAEDIMQALEKVGLPCKPPMVSAAAQPQNILNTQINFSEDSFGMNRNYLNNSYTPSTRLSLYENKRGKSTGKSLDEMSEEEIRNENISKKTLLRVTAKMYDISQKFYSPLLMNGKILYRQVNTLLPNDSDYGTPIKSVSPKLDQHVKDFLIEAKDFVKKIGPKPVWCVPTGYTPRSFIVSTDGSGTSVAAVLHVVSTKNDEAAYGPKLYSGLYLAKQQLNARSTSTISEMLSIKLGIMLIMGVLEDIKHLIEDKYDCYLLNDNCQMSCNFSPLQGTTKPAVKNVVNSVKAGLLLISQMPNTEFIRLAFVSGHRSIADLCSKYSKNVTEVVQSIKWNYGIAQYVKRQVFNKTTWLYCDNKTGCQYTKLPKNLHDQSDPELEYLTPPKKREKRQKQISQDPTALHQAVKMNSTERDEEMVDTVRLVKTSNKEQDLSDSDSEESEDDIESYESYLRKSLYCTPEINDNTSSEDLATLAAFFAGQFNNNDNLPHFLWTTERTGSSEQNTETGFIDTVFCNEKELKGQEKGIKVVTRKQAKDQAVKETNAKMHDTALEETSTKDNASKLDQTMHSDQDPDSNTLGTISVPGNHMENEKFDVSWSETPSIFNMSSISKHEENKAKESSNQCQKHFGYCPSKPLELVDRATTISRITREFDVMRPKKGSRNMIQLEVSSIFKGHLDLGDYKQIVERYGDGRKSYRVGLCTMMAIIKWKVILERFRGNKFKSVTDETKTIAEDKPADLYSSDQPKNSNVAVNDEVNMPPDPTLIIFKERDSSVGVIDPFLLYHETWALLVRSDQKHYRIGKRTEKDVLMTKSGIKVLEDRMDNEQAIAIFGVDYLPILSKESPLLKSKLHIAHKRSEMDYENPAKPWIGVHCDQVSTKINLRTGNTGVKCVAMDEVVYHYASKCPPCNRTKLQYFQSYLGQTMHCLDYSTPLFQKISIDPAYPMWVYPNQNSRKPVRMYLLAIACLTTFATRLIVIPNITLKSIKAALQLLQLQSATTLVSVHTDHGTQFAGKLREIFPGVKITCSHRLSQRTNYVENRIRLAKSVFRRILQVTPKEPSEWKVDMFNLQIILTIVENSINSLPFNTKAGSSRITPDHFVRPFQFIKTMLDGDSDDKGHNAFIEQRVQGYFKKIIGIRNQEILIEENRFRRKLGNKGKYKIKIDDVVFIKNTDFSKIKIGKVEEISKSGNSIKIWFPSNGKSSGKNKSYNIKDVHPLVHGP